MLQASKTHPKHYATEGRNDLQKHAAPKNNIFAATAVGGGAGVRCAAVAAILAVPATVLQLLLLLVMLVLASADATAAAAAPAAGAAKLACLCFTSPAAAAPAAVVVRNKRVKSIIPWRAPPCVCRGRRIYSSLCAFLPPKVNCAICSPQLVYVCVCLHLILGQMPNFGKFFLVKHVIYSSLFVFYVSQSELRHLQCTVSVCVCACIWSRVNCLISASFSRWIVLFTARCVRNVVRIQRKRKQSLFTKNSDAFRGRAICQK